MELVYLWVEKLGKEHKGFTFSGQFTFNLEAKFDSSGNLLRDSKLIISYTKKENIFSDNINITAIVGENGSGKSKLLQTILDNVNEHNISDDRESFIQCYFDGKDKVWIDAKLNKDNLQIMENGIEHQYIDDNLFRDKSFFYHYKNDMDLCIMNNKYGIYNLNIIKLCEPNKQNNIINIEIEEEKTLKKIIYMIDEKYSQNIDNNFFVPNELFLKKFFPILLGQNTTSDNIYKSLRRNFITNDDYKYLLLLENILYVSALMAEKKNSLLLQDIILPPFDILSSSIDQEIRKYKDDFMGEKYEEIIVKTREIIKDNHNIDNYTESLVINEFEKVLNLFNSIDKIVKLINKIGDNSYTIDINILQEDDKNIKLLQMLPRFLKIELRDNRTGKIYSELSTGEKSLLDVIFSIKYIIDLRDNLSDNIFILLDEIESYLHPNWQRRIINYIYTFIKKYECNIHIILASHSPFLLSDLPKENVIFLKNGKQDYPFKDKQTFGANIHTLLSDGFFMEDGLMGEFAKGKIEEIIKILKSKRKLSEKNQKLCKSIISIIGEPVLRNTLQSMLEEKLYSNESKLDKLKRKQKEIEEELKKEELKGKSNEKN